MRAVNKVLFVTMTNIGDILMSLPTLDLLRHLFPQARVTVVAGPRAAGVFEGNPVVHRFIAFDKYASFSDKFRLFRRLQAEDFDLVIDLRNSLFGYLLGKIRMPLFPPIQAGNAHSWERHRAKARFLMPRGDSLPERGGSITFTSRDREYVDGLLAGYGIGKGDRPVVICPGARSQTKCWEREKYCGLAAVLAEKAGPVVITGDGGDLDPTGYICRNVPSAVGIAGKTSFLQLAYLLSRSAVLIANDSGAMHIASYLNVPTVGIFGPSDEVRYGPWSRYSRAVKKDVFCRPCMRAQCADSSFRCLRTVGVEDVARAAFQLLAGNH